MRMPICRFALGLVVWLLAAGFFQPALASACGNGAQPDCCKAPVANEIHHSTAPDQRCPLAPASSSLCCSFCPLVLSLIASDHAPFVFNDASVTAFVIQDPAFLTRTTRPPYPPPRG